MPTWVWMVVQNRDREAVEFSRVWLAERQAVVDRVGELYGVNLP